MPSIQFGDDQADYPFLSEGSHLAKVDVICPFYRQG